MLEARRSPTQETHGDTVEGAAKEDAGIVPLGIPMLAGPGAISSVMVLVGQVPTLWGWQMGADSGVDRLDDCGDLFCAGRGGASAGSSGRDGHPHSGQDHGIAAGGAGDAVFREWNHGLRVDSAAHVIRRLGGLFPTESAGFPQDVALESNPLKMLIFSCCKPRICVGLRSLHLRVACATLIKVSVSSGASRWPVGPARSEIRILRILDLREVGSWFVGSDEFCTMCTVKPL